MTECRHCHQWPTAPDDSYCSFCGQMLLSLEVTPDALVLISVLVPQRELVLRNTGAETMQVSIVPRGAPFAAIAFEPGQIVSIPPNGETRVRATIDAAQLPADFVERRVDYVCIVNDSPSKQRPLSVTARCGPKPVVFTPLVEFGNVEEGKHVERAVEIGNRGGIPLRLRSVRSEGAAQLRVHGNFADRIIAPTEKLVIPVAWESTVVDAAPESGGEAGIRIEFANHAEALFVPAHARLFRYQLALKPAALRIRKALVKREVSSMVRLENHGTTDVDVVGIDSEEPWINIVSRAASMTLLCAESAGQRPLSPTTFARGYDFKVVCRPGNLAEGKHRGSVTIRPHGQEPLILPVDLDVIHPRPYQEYIGIDFGTTNSVVAVLNQKNRSIELVSDETSGKHLIPSVLVFDDPETYKIGQAARNEAGAAPDRTVRSIKRVMGFDNDRQFFDRSYTAGELASLIVRKLVQLAEKKLLDDSGNYYDVRKAIITVPANFYDLQIREVLDACKAAGLDTEGEKADRAAQEVRQAIGEAVNAGVILDEPSAAVLYYVDHLRRTRSSAEITRAIDRDGGLRLLVFDYGGGTLDVSVASVTRVKGGGTGLRILANMGDNTIGGDTIDLIVMKDLLKRCKEKVGGFDFETSLISMNYKDLETRWDREGWSADVWRELLRVRAEWKDLAENAKIQMAERKPAPLDIAPALMVRIADGALQSAPRAVRIEPLSGERSEDLLQPIVAKCGDLVTAALDLAGIGNGDIDYILHTGRQSLLPAIRKRVRALFPNLPAERDLLEEEHLKVCVAKGAALYGAMRGALVARPDAQIHFLNEGRRLPHSYGVETFINPLEPELDEIIKRGDTYPVERTKPYPPEMIPPGGCLNLRFYQNTGTSRLINRNAQITLVGQISIDTNADGKRGVDVSFVVGANRTLEVFADGKRVTIERARLQEEEGWMS
ncbi:MAG TPA: Hsp70 family protein [Thermoanaerobaculia bacterium]|jgi:molecular chaperone DnaK